MEWIGMILKSEITKFAFSFIVVLHHKMLYFIVLQVVNTVFSYVLQNGNMHTAKINYSFKITYYLYCS